MSCRFIEVSAPHSPQTQGATSELACLPKNWNQGKAHANVIFNDTYFVCLRIGIKAKLVNRGLEPIHQFVCLRIGIKAKRDLLGFGVGNKFVCLRIGIKAKRIPQGSLDPN